MEIEVSVEEITQRNVNFYWKGENFSFSAEITLEYLYDYSDEEDINFDIGVIPDKNGTHKNHFWGKEHYRFTDDYTFVFLKNEYPKIYEKLLEFKKKVIETLQNEYSDV